MKSIFINKNSQLRSGWKILLALISVFASMILLSLIFNIILQIILSLISSDGIKTRDSLINDGLVSFVNQALMEVCLILIPILLWKTLDKKPIREMGLVNIKKGYRDLIFGLLLGAASITIVFVALLNVGNVSLVNSLSHPNISSAIVTGLIIFIAVGFAEEIFSRGYCMTVINQGKHKWLGVIISAAIFSAMHAGNPNTRPLAFINIFLVGLLFGYMYLKSLSIWLPIGYHITWNYFQGNVWGFEVSGTPAQGIYQTHLIQENLLNGGKFGPEGGLIVTIIIILGFFVVREYYKVKNI